MIIIRYKGGLGNQMFQYAMQLCMEQCYPEEEVLADLSHYLLKNEHNGYELQNIWGIELKRADVGAVKRLSPYYIPGKLYSYLTKGMKKLVADNLQYKYLNWRQKNRNLLKTYHKQADHCCIEEELFHLLPNEDIYLDGLWQNIRYLEGIEENLRKAFSFHGETYYQPEDKEWISRIRDTLSISVHVRRGDFKNSKFDICSQEYYRKAFQVMEGKIKGVSDRECHFFFFTDDVSYVEETFRYIPKNRMTVVHHEVDRSFMDMELMSMCKHHIISNSTFAWWAAWLDKKDAVTVAPYYSVMKKEKAYPLSCPKEWIKVNA